MIKIIGEPPFRSIEPKADYHNRWLIKYNSERCKYCPESTLSVMRGKNIQFVW